MTVKFKEKMIRFIDYHCMAIIGALYTITALVVVASAWIENIFRYNLSLTISIYVALRPWTAVLYFIVAIMMTAMGIRYIHDCVNHKGKRCVYYIVFACILGCALCPCNSEWSMIIYQIHNVLAIVLMLMAFVSFAFALVKARCSLQRIVSIISICYAIFFIAAYLVFRFNFFFMTLFIWENVFIYMLLANLYLEKLK